MAITKFSLAKGYHQHFKTSGHHHITAIVPECRRWKPKSELKKLIKDQHILKHLHKEGVIKFTPAKDYDDRYV